MFAFHRLAVLIFGATMMAAEAGKGGKKKGGSSDVDCDSATYTRTVYSSVSPNEDWESNHRYQPLVVYHTLDQAHALWQEGYFDYVIDTRTFEDLPFGGSSLPGWETYHIPGAYLVPWTGCLDGSKEECFSLADFLSSAVCKDARILVHCWTGIAANNALEALVNMGFTNMHGIGPERTGGILEWNDKGYEVEEGGYYDMERQPECSGSCTPDY